MKINTLDSIHTVIRQLFNLAIDGLYQKEMGLTRQAAIDGYTDFIFLNRFGSPHNPQTINRTILENLEGKIKIS